MNTTEDFENAPVGATATHKASGSRALKTEDQTLPWTSSQDTYFKNATMAGEGYTLDSPAPTTASEAIGLVWKLAHEVKLGQVIPKGARYLEATEFGLREFTALSDFKITPELALIFRTVEPLPDPEPDWSDAPAILASHPLCADTERIGIWLPSLYKIGMWELPVQQGEFRVHWSELENVAPLYPKETEA